MAAESEEGGGHQSATPDVGANLPRRQSAVWWGLICIMDGQAMEMHKDWKELIVHTSTLKSTYMYLCPFLKKEQNILFC